MKYGSSRPDFEHYNTWLLQMFNKNDLRLLGYIIEMTLSNVIYAELEINQAGSVLSLKGKWQHLMQDDKQPTDKEGLSQS